MHFSSQLSDINLYDGISRWIVSFLPSSGFARKKVKVVLLVSSVSAAFLQHLCFSGVTVWMAAWLTDQ